MAITESQMNTIGKSGPTIRPKIENQRTRITRTAEKDVIRDDHDEIAGQYGNLANSHHKVAWLNLP